MKSTFFGTALMSSIVVAHRFDHFAHLPNNGLGDNSWENIDPIQALTTTTTSRFRPALSSATPFAQTTSSTRTTSYAVPAALTSAGLQQAEWNHVNQLVSTTSVFVEVATTSSFAVPAALTTTVSVEAVNNGHWKPWNSAYTSARLLTITSSSTYLEVKTITETLAQQPSSTTTEPVVYTTPEVYYRTTAPFVASTTAAQVVNGQPPVYVAQPPVNPAQPPVNPAQPPVNPAQPPVNAAQPPVNAGYQAAGPVNSGLAGVPVQASATTSPNVFIAQPSAIATYTGSAAGIRSGFFFMISVMILGLAY